MRKIILILILLSQNVYATVIASGNILDYYHTLATELCSEYTDCTVKQTRGSLENLKLLENKEVDYALIQSNLLDEKREIIKEINTVETFNVFYKGSVVNSWKELIATKDFTLDKESGTYGVFMKISKALGTENASITLRTNLKNRPLSFCERKTTATFQNVNITAFTSLLFKVDKIKCNTKQYKFTKQEIELLEKVGLSVEKGVVYNTIYLVK